VAIGKASMLLLTCHCRARWIEAAKGTDRQAELFGVGKRACLAWTGSLDGGGGGRARDVLDRLQSA
jgi:hypothetical protein